jgi:hypothetical protein
MKARMPRVMVEARVIGRRILDIGIVLKFIAWE